MTTKQRFQALDVMRGLTLALMILVNTPGSWSYVYSPLLHADWHGATPTDYIFPFFLFMVGAAMVFSQKSLNALSFSDQATKIFRRTLVIFLIGLLLNYFPFTEDPGNLRFLGVLQRIALAYCFAAWIVLYANTLWRLVIAAALLLGYWALLQLNADPYSLEDSVVRQFDIWVLGEQHLWRGKGIAFDPEGLLSTLPAIVNVLIGYEVTRHLISASDKIKAQWQLFAAGVVMTVLGVLWHPVFPINKSLWTSSFVLLTSGVGVLVLLVLVRLEAFSFMQGIYKAFTMLGQNPLFIYALSILWAKTLLIVPVGEVSAYQWLYDQLCKVVDPYNASLMFALIPVAVLWVVAWYLHRKKIIISI